MNSGAVRYEEIPVQSIVEGPVQIRKFYDPGLLKQLAESQGEMGTLQLIVVRPASDERFELIIGSRRVRAARDSRMERIPACILPSVEDSRAMLMALSENFHRVDLSPFEEGAAILKLVHEHGVSVPEISRSLKRDVTWVTRRIKLLSLPAPVQGMFSKGRLQLHHVDKLVTLSTKEDQLKFARIAAQRSLSPVELSTLIKRETTSKSARVGSSRLLSGERAALQIQAFTDWLKQVPGNRAILGGDMLRLRRSLCELKRETEAALKRIERKG